jgi:hypothetical protein
MLYICNSKWLSLNSKKVNHQKLIREKEEEEVLNNLINKLKWKLLSSSNIKVKKSLNTKPKTNNICKCLNFSLLNSIKFLLRPKVISILILKMLIKDFSLTINLSRLLSLQLCIPNSPKVLLIPRIL